jgi:hypothetical protein
VRKPFSKFGKEEYVGFSFVTFYRFYLYRSRFEPSPSLHLLEKCNCYTVLPDSIIGKKRDVFISKPRWNTGGREHIEYIDEDQNSAAFCLYMASYSI